MDAPYEVDTLTLENFEFKGKPKPYSRGTIQECEYSDGRKKTKLMIRTIEKNDENDMVVDAELDALASISHPCIAPLKYYFSDKNNHYLVYKRPAGKNLAKRIKKIGVVPDDLVQGLAEQFISVIETCERNEIHYMRDDVDNIYVNGDLYITIVGLDCTSINIFAQTDQTPSKGTSWISLGHFVYRLLKGKAPENTLESSLDGKVKDFLEKTIYNTQVQRDDLKPRSLAFMRHDFEVKANPDGLQVGDLALDWKGGFVVTVCGVSVGWKDGLYFKFGSQRSKQEIEEDKKRIVKAMFGEIEGNDENNSVEVTLGAGGLEVVDSESDTTMKINETGLSAESESSELDVKLGTEGISIKSKKEGGVTVQNNGDFKIDLGENKVSMTNGDLDVKCDPKEYSLKLKGGGALVSIGKAFSLFIGKYFRIKFGPASVKIDPKGTFVLKIGPIGLKILTSGKLIISMGGMSITISPEGIEIEGGSMLAQINAEGLKIDADAFHITLGSDGPKFDCDYNLDLDDYLSNIQNVHIEIQFPKIPGLPEIPKIDKGLPKLPGLDFTRPDPPGEPQDVSVYLEEGEQVKLLTEVIKTVFLSHKHRMMVLTSNNRVFYCTPNFSVKRGDIVFGAKSDLILKDDNILIVKNFKGTKFHLTFDEEDDRTRWYKALKPIVAQAVAKAKAEAEEKKKKK